MLEKEIILRMISEDKFCRRKRLARKGQDYYDARHDIMDYRVFYINEDGKLEEDITRSNSRVPHPFFTEIVDQEVGYILSGGVKITAADPELEDVLEEYFGDDFIGTLAEVLTDVVARGWGWIYWYQGEDERLHFAYADSLGIVEVKTDSAAAKNDYIIRYYKVAAKDHRMITRVEVWDEKQTWYFLMSNGTLEPDKDVTINPRPHVLYRRGEEYYYRETDRLPFLRLDNNRKQASGLMPVKAIIDDYDIMDCGLSNNLTDIQEGIYVVKGYKGTDLTKLRTNVKSKKIIGVGEKGDLDIKTVNIPYEARKVKLEEDEKNIYRFSMSFNSAQTGDGNITNVVIQSRYTLLDIKASKLKIRLKKFMLELIRVVLQEINGKRGTDYDEHGIQIDFPSVIPTSDKDDAEIAKLQAEARQVEVDTILSTAAALDNDTVVGLICEALDLDEEAISSAARKGEPEAAKEALNEQVSEAGGAGAAGS